MARLAGKARGDMRAMEEQMERHNPINPQTQLRGRGATPSMGLSQFRGGRSSSSSGESGEEMRGGGFLSDLGIPVVSQLAGMVGLGGGDMSRMVGCGTKKGQMRKTARRAYEGMGTGGMSEATAMGLHLGKHLHGLHGAGFFEDFGRGFMSVIRPAAGIAKAVAPLLGPEGMAASGVLNAVGLGSARRGARGRPRKGMETGAGKLVITHGGATNSDTGAYEGHGREREDRAMTGLGRRRRAPAGANDGRRKRAEVVKRVMAERGCSMIEASKYVKAHGLY